MSAGFDPAVVAATGDAARRGRSPLERLLVARPDLARRLSAVVVGPRPGRVRQGLIAWTARLTFRAWSRRDWELNTLMLDPDEYEFMIGDPAGKAPGMREHYEGIPGYLEAQLTMLEVFQDMNVELERLGWVPDGRLAGLLHFSGSGGGSGVAIEQRAMIAVEFRRGLVARQWYWWDVDVACQSLGIEPPQR